MKRKPPKVSPAAMPAMPQWMKDAIAAQYPKAEEWADMLKGKP